MVIRGEVEDIKEGVDIVFGAVVVGIGVVVIGVGVRL